MKRKMFMVKVLTVVFCLSLGSLAGAATLSFTQLGGILPNAPDYEWWYGCTPTSAGMMMGYYDRNGYGGLQYDNLIPGGVAELSNYGNPAALANEAIASAGHRSAFYISGYLGSGDDIPANHPSFDSLADFMGTSQDSVGNKNGSTTLYFWSNGQRFTAQDSFNFGVWNSDGMYGMWEYFVYAGYNVSRTNFWTQAIYNSQTMPLGFTFDDYKAEIDAGRVVMLHVTGHTMFGYGYDPDGTVYLHDTWNAGQKTMMWGGSYAGLDQWGVTGFTPESGGSPVPEPGTFLMVSSGLVGVLGLRRKFKV
jgi:hypothetical protein